MGQERVVYKQQPVLARHLDNGYEFDVRLPESATIIHVGLQGDGDDQKLTFWYTFDAPDYGVQTRRYAVAGTGANAREYVDPERHVATIFEDTRLDIEDFVWHIFEVTP